MRSLPTCLCPLLLLCCQGSAPPSTLPNGFVPRVPLVERIPPGTAVRAEVGPGLPDEPRWRAAGIWWREALRQSPVFALREGDGAAQATIALRVAIEPASATVAVFLLRGERMQALAGDAFADGDLPAALDRLAWSARRALGDDGPAPVPVALCVAADPVVAVAVDDAATLLRDGAVTGAHKALLGARRRDGGAPAVLDGLAAVALLRGDAALAERLCIEALGYASRLSPTLQHRLARTLLLARAATDPAHAARHDEELLALAQAGRRERPHDFQPVLSEAIALDFLGDFARARPLLEQLREQAPDQPIVAYHLGWACLATGEGPAALTHLEAAAVRLPVAWLVVPRAIACFAAGRTAELGELLATFQREVRNPHDPVAHEIRRMQAAQALLADDGPAAREHILLDLQWLLQNPEVLERRAGEFAEQAAVLVRLGGDAGLPALLAALQSQHSSTAVADACAFVQGMLQVGSRRERATELEGQLARGGESAWSALLAAYAHEVRGEIQDMHQALGRAVRLADSPMTKALLVRCLRAAGRHDEAITLRDTLRRELLAIRLRRAPQHPVLGPEFAFAWRCD